MWGRGGFEQQRLSPDSVHSLSTVLCGDRPLQGQVTKAGGLGLAKACPLVPQSPHEAPLFLSRRRGWCAWVC